MSLYCKGIRALGLERAMWQEFEPDNSTTHTVGNVRVCSLHGTSLRGLLHCCL